MCNKYVYISKKEAKSNLNHLRKGRLFSIFKTTRRKIKIRPARIYYCIACNGWHLTSRVEENIFEPVTKIIILPQLKQLYEQQSTSSRE